MSDSSCSFLTWSLSCGTFQCGFRICTAHRLRYTLAIHSSLIKIGLQLLERVLALILFKLLRCHLIQEFTDWLVTSTNLYLNIVALDLQVH